MSFSLQLAGASALLDLFENLKFEFGDDVLYVVGPTVRYAVYVDKGTSRMEARPFVRPAAERVQANLDTMVGQFLDASVLDADEEQVAEAAALAVEAEMKRIITRKGAVDTGTMRSSVSIERVD